MSLMTISKGMGTGGTAIAKRVAEKLNLELYDDQRLQQEFNRNCLKAKELIKPNYGNDSLYAEAKRIIDSKISAKWWQFIKHTYHRGECT